MKSSFKRQHKHATRQQPLCEHTDQTRAPTAWKMGDRCIDCARAIRAERQRKYLDSPKGQETRKRYSESERGKEAHRVASTRYRQRKIAERDPRYRYCKQKAHAAERGIQFLLTFDEWWALWEPFWQLRGRGRSNFVMARNGDKGPYAVGNVRIITQEQNRLEALELRRQRILARRGVPKRRRATAQLRPGDVARDRRHERRRAKVLESHKAAASKASLPNAGRAAAGAIQ